MTEKELLYLVGIWNAVDFWNNDYRRPKNAEQAYLLSVNAIHCHETEAEPGHLGLMTRENPGARL